MSFILAAQNFRVREPIERIADICGVIEIPAAYKRVRERFDRVAVKRFQDVYKAGCNGAHSIVSNALAALKRDRQGANGRAVSHGRERQNVTVSGRTNGENVPRVGRRAGDANRTGKAGE